MSDLLLNPAVQSGVLPLAVAFAAAGLLGLAPATRGVAQVAVALGFLAAYGIVVGLPAFPPTGSNQKVAYLIAAAFACGLLLDLGKAAPRLQLGVAAMLFVTGVVWLAWPRLDGGTVVWMTAVAAIAGGLVCIAATWRSLDDGVDAGAMLVVAATGLGVVSLMGGSASILQLAAALAAAVGGFLLWNWPRQRHPLGGVISVGAAVVLALLAAQTALYTRASPAALALLVPVFLAALPWRGRKLPAALRPVLVGLAALVPAVAAVVAAWLAGGDVYTG